MEPIDDARPWAGERWLTALLVAGSVLFVFLQLRPDLLFAKTTAAGGDMGAHVWAPAYMRDELLPRWRLSGWTPDWYAGFPAYQFYMVVPSLLIVLLDVLFLPYVVAFKVVSVLGLLALPVAAWALGRLSRLPFPAPAALAVAAVPFIFERSFTIYGGNAASTLAGEFSFSISLAICVVYLGVVLRGLETGRHRAWAAALFALTALCHVIPVVFAVLGTFVALVVSVDWRDPVRNGWAKVRWLAPVVAVGGLLSAFWTVPFLLRRDYMTDMGWEKLTNYTEALFPGRIGRFLSDGPVTIHADMTWVIALALVGAISSIVFKRRLGIFLVLLAGLLAVAVVVAPTGRLWNARLLPFWYLCLYLLAALAVAEVLWAIAILTGDVRAWVPRAITTGGAVALALVTIVAVALPLRVLPRGAVQADGEYHWYGLSTKDSSFVPAWVKWNYSGYERKTAYPEYHDIVQTMARVGRTEGCGRTMWEYDGTLDRFGTPMALMLLPYWTHGCIGSMEGLYFESSATTPYHFLNAAELSAKPSNPQRDLPYGTLDVGLGVRHLQMLGVRYYLAFSDQAIQQADTTPGLRLVGRTRSWVNERDGSTVRWRVYEVADSELVEPLPNQPAVVTGWGKGHADWQDLAVGWYLDPTRWSTELAQDGPSSWRRVADGARPASKPVPQAEVTRIRSDEDTISFHVDRVGTPVLVKTSYFPNWKASGADGPYRVAPNLMVVVPKAKDVRLQYGRTGVDWLGIGLTLLGIALLVTLGRLDRRRRLAGADGAVEAHEADRRAGDPADDRAPGGAPLLDDDGELGDREPLTLGAEHELGVEEVLAEHRHAGEGLEPLAPEGLHPMGVGGPEAEPGAQHEGEAGGDDPAGDRPLVP